MPATRGTSKTTGSEISRAATENPLDILAEAAASAAPEVPVTRTRSGRVSKPPERYEPIEQVEDDYGEDDYDTEDPDDISEDIKTESEDEEDDESDADEDGNLDGFVVPDKSESDISDSDDGEPAVSNKKPRAPVKKRTPAA